MLAPLSDSERVTVVSAMHRMEGLLACRSAAPSGYTIRGLQIGDVGWIIHRQAAGDIGHHLRGGGSRECKQWHAWQDRPERGNP